MSALLASRFTSGPALVAPHMSDWANNCIAAIDAQVEKLAPTISAEQYNQIKESMSNSDDDGYWPEEGSFMSFLKPYKVTSDGTLIVPIKGMLLHDMSFQIGNWATGYTYVRKAFERGMADEDVTRIVALINSGGGEVAGNFDLVDALYNMRGQKPMVAVVNEHAYSAAFSIASAMDKIFLPRTGGVGSVGVVMGHVDQSQALEKAGVKITFIHAGEHKVEGNSYEPLTADVKKRMQARIDGLYNIFVSTVARNLGMDEKAVRGTEALTYSAEDAVSIGFATTIASYEDAMAAPDGRSDQTEKEVDDMADANTKQAASTFSQADLNEAKAAAKAEGVAEGKAEGMKEGATAERERISGILGCDEAKNRATLATHLAMKTGTSVEDAKGLLANSAEEAAKPEATPKAESHFDKAMGRQNPEIQPESGAGAEGEEFNPVAFIKSQNASAKAE